MGLVSLEEEEETPETSLWAHTEESPCEDAGRRRPPTSQGERPHQKRTLTRDRLWSEL